MNNTSQIRSFPGGFVRDRLPIYRNIQWGITSYGADNLYPQRMKELAKRSPLCSSSIRLLHEFTIGDGWEQNGSMVINEDGQTFNELLNLLAKDFSTFDGFSFHLNFNGVGDVTELQYVPFELVRLGILNRQGKTDVAKISHNWERNASKDQSFGQIEIQEYPLLDFETAGMNAITTGTGQLFYYSHHFRNYPLATFDPVADAVQVDFEIQQFELANIQNGFLGSTLFKWPSKIESEDERLEIERKINEIKGSYNANSIILASMDAEDVPPGSLIESIPANNNDRLFEFTRQDVTDQILANFSIPKSLLGISPSGTFINKEDLSNSFTWFNMKTRNRRKVFEHLFNDKFGFSLGKIVEQEFHEGNIDAQPAPAPPAPENEMDDEESEPTNKLEMIYGKSTYKFG